MAVLAWAVLAATVAWPLGTRGRWLAALAVLTLAGWVLGRLRTRRRRARHTGRHSRRSRLPAFALLAVGAVALLQVGAGGHDLIHRIGPLSDLAAQRATATVVGQVSSEPRTTASRFGAETVILTLDVREVAGRAGDHAAYAPVTVRGGTELLKLRWWSTIQVTGRLSLPPEPGPQVADLRATGPPVLVAEPNLVARGAEVLRAALRDSVSGLPADARGLLPGLVIGDTSAVPGDLDQAMRATGMTHLTAVSGSNVAVVVGLGFALCAFVGMPRRLRPLVALAVLAGFVVLARPDPSVIRAAVMGAIGLLGISRSQRAAGLPVLGSAILAALVWDPWLSRSFGFVLSTLATLGLLLFAGPWGEAIARRLPRRLRLLGPAVAVPLAAQMMCGPIIVLLSGSVSLVGVVANLLAAPLVPVATIGGVACAGIGVVSRTLAGCLAWVPGLPTLGIAWVARTLADVPGGSLPWPKAAAGAWLLALLTVVAVFLGRSLLRLAWARPVVAIGTCLALIALLVPTKVVTWPAANWRVVICDVGQGDGIVVRSGPTAAVVVDVGPDPNLIDGCLDRLGVRTIDAVVLTHFHADHVDGITGTTRGRTVHALITTNVRDPPAQVKAVDRWAAEQGLSAQQVHPGEVLRFGEATATVWAPVRRIDTGSVPNNASIVLAVETGGARALLMGDVEREAGAAVMGEVRGIAQFAQQSRSFDLVKTPHHGSANLDPDLMSAVRAPVAVISVGADNDYGHPAPSHLSLLHRLGYAVYRTDQVGDVALVETPEGAAVATRG